MKISYGTVEWRIMKLSVSVFFLVCKSVRHSLAFSSPRIELGSSPTTRRDSRHTSFQSAVSDPTTAGSNHTVDDDEDSGIDLIFDVTDDDMFMTSQPKYSKAKWKKKRFLMKSIGPI